MFQEEIQQQEVRSKRRHYFRISLMTFSFFVLSLALTLPPYYVPKSGKYLLVASAVFSFVFAMVAVSLAVVNMSNFIRQPQLRRSSKTYFPTVVNMLILGATLYNVWLWLQKV